MNIGEKISLYKERLGFKNYQDFGKAVGINGSWILDISKKSNVGMIDLENLIKLSEYLNVSIDQLVKDDESEKVEDIKNLDKEDIGYIIELAENLLGKDEVRMNGKLLNDKAKEVCKDSLQVVKQLTRQYL